MRLHTQLGAVAANSLAMSATHYPAEVVDEVNAILSQDPKVVGPITMWKQALAVLTKAKISYEVENVHGRLFLVHPHNRSKLGVNAYNVHRVGALIKRVGADLNEVKKATAFELHPSDPKRSDQVSFNRKLVDRADGMLSRRSQVVSGTSACHVDIRHSLPRLPTLLAARRGQPSLTQPVA